MIFDEAQTLPVPYLRPCVAAIAELVKRYRVTAVLCTATQPALGRLFREFAPELHMREICQITKASSLFFRRTTLTNIGSVSKEDMAGRLNRHAQVLCVVNCRRTAISLFKRLSGDGNFCLTTLLCPADRCRKLDEIRERLRNGLPCRVVSTSLIEAGIDVDFPVAYREETGLDSILQTAGRCNREGRRPARESPVCVFRLDGMPVPQMLSQNISAAREVFRNYVDPASQEAIRQYFSFFYSLKGNAGQDQKEILAAFQKGIAGNLFPFRTVAERFHLIGSSTYTIFIPVGEGAALTERLRTGEISRTLYRALGKYGVDVYPAQFKTLTDAGALEIAKSGFAILRSIERYRLDVGLTLDPEDGEEWSI